MKAGRSGLRTLLTLILLWAASAATATAAVDARFDLVGPRIDIRVTRAGITLPIASVPNLQPGDKLWIHPDMPRDQSVNYLLICVFLRGITNPPPEDWFFRIETWNRKVAEEGTVITVPQDAQQAVMFLAPETGGDFSTLKSAVRGTPGTFVRASQDLAEAGFEQARIERYLGEIRRVPPGDADSLQRHSDLLARTLALKPNSDCFKRPEDQQFSCLTQSGSQQVLLDDGHGQNIASALSNGPSSDLINQASYTQLAGAGSYSAYVGAIVDLVRIMGNLHTAQYRYIPAIAFPQGAALNLRLNTPPSFHNPKSVLVIGLPRVEAASAPPLRPSDPDHTTCLLKPSVVLQVEGAPLVFSTDFATGLVLHLNTPPGAPAEPDIPLVADAYEGGLILQQGAEHHVPLRDERAPLTVTTTPAGVPAAKPDPRLPARPRPVSLTGTVEGRWGFDPFTGPTLKLQQLPGGDWHIISHGGGASELIAGKTSELYIGSSGSACVHTVTAEPQGSPGPMDLTFKQQPSPDYPDQLAIALPSDRQLSPGSLHLEIQQYGQPKPDELAARTFADPPEVAAVQLPAGDRTMMLTGQHLESISRLRLGDLVFHPEPLPQEGSTAITAPGTLRLALPNGAPPPPTHPGEHLVAQLTLNDGRELTVPFTVQPARPSVTLLSRSFDTVPGSVVSLSSPDDLPLSSHISFTLKSRTPFPRNGEVEIETLDGTLRAVLTLAPSGGLILQDPHTIVAAFDPLRSFGPSAFGALQLRVSFPEPQGKGHHGEPSGLPGEPGSVAHPSDADQATGDPADAENRNENSDWLPLGTLVRMPVLAHLQCPTESSSPCSLYGQNLFLLQAVSADPAFADPAQVPDGFTGSSLSVPHPIGSAGTLFLKLRDDPAPVDSATLTTSPAPGTSHTRNRY